MNKHSTLALGLLVLTLLALLGGTSMALAAPEVILTVNSANDANDGLCNATHCSLREAINSANAAPDLDTIRFNIPANSPNCDAAAVCTITPVTSLPMTTAPLVINGYSQPGATPNTLAVGNDAVLKIVLDGSIAHSTGLWIYGGDSTLKGLVVINFGTGIFLNSENNVLRGNFVGLGADGLTAHGNSNGVHIDRDHNQVGGLPPGDRNVISSSAERALSVYGSYTVIQGNYLGVARDGITARPNGYNGLWLHKTAFNTVGGDSDAARNVISGNSSTGLAIDDTANTLFQKNYIGIGADGTTAVPNGGAGISMSTDDADPPTRENLFLENQIANNGGEGILVYAFYSEYIQSNTFSRNRIWNNGGLGIDLNDNGITYNDASDADEGPNGLLNFPTNVHAKVLNGSTIITGKIKAAANKKYRVEIFLNDTCDSNGYGEGQKFFEEVTVTTDGAGQAEWEVVKNQTTNLSKRVTTTATHMQGLTPRATSEFSKCIAFKLPN